MRTRATRVVAAIVLIAFSAACTRTARIPISDYEKFSARPTEGYQVKTTDGQVYQVWTVVMRDTVLVIDDPVTPTHDSRLYPVLIGLSRVESIDYLQGNKTVGNIIAVGLLVPLVFVIVLGLAWDCDGGWGGR